MHKFHFSNIDNKVSTLSHLSNNYTITITIYFKTQSFIIGNQLFLFDTFAYSIIHALQKTILLIKLFDLFDLFLELNKLTCTKRRFQAIASGSSVVAVNFCSFFFAFRYKLYALVYLSLMPSFSTAVLHNFITTFGYCQ